jgi:mono/diheme cytochrome c family protein
MKCFRIIICFGAMALLASCGTIATREATTPPLDTALITRGIEVYRAQYCGSCHTLTAANTRGTFGPNHDQVAANALEHLTASDYSGQADTLEAYLRESLLEPAIYFVPGYEITQHHMPPYGHLPAADIDALVYMLAHQS